MPNGSPILPGDMPTLPVYEGCWYHGSADEGGGAIPHTICGSNRSVAAGAVPAGAAHERVAHTPPAPHLDRPGLSSPREGRFLVSPPDAPGCLPSRVLLAHKLKVRGHVFVAGDFS